MIRKPNFKLNWKYAIGEIALIFIGITAAIAFQNWNDNRKAKHFENEILDEISASLVLDEIELNNILENFQRADNAAIKILGYQGTQVEKDSISYWLGQFINFDRFNPSSSPYEVLKSEGLQAISNKELRLLISQYYDDAVPSIIASLYDVEEDFETNAFGFFHEEFEDFEFKQYVKPKDIDLFMADRSNIIYIKFFRGNRAGAIDDLIEGLTSNNKVRTNIKSDLHH
jgi:hypothetical protein